jgi:hypothetical protein
MLLLVMLHAVVFCHAQDDEYVSDTIASVSPPMMEKEHGSFYTILQTDPVAVRRVPRQKVDELKNDDAYWYANQVIEKKKKKQVQPPPSANKGLLDAAWFRNILWIIILCSFIGVIIWYLASSNISLFQKSARKIFDEEAETELSDDIFSIQYDKEIQKAVDAKNYRLATRLWYLETLTELSDRNIIEYGHDKTNQDYVNSLYGGKYYRDFFRLTRNFEYTWYGQFNLSAEAYELMRADFTKFKNSLS